MESTLRLLIQRGDGDGTPASELALVHSVLAAVSGGADLEMPLDDAQVALVTG
jgi:hypothetical protein